MGRELAKAERVDGESAVQRVYDKVKAMAISFELRPGERLNELEIAREIGVSRTPLREALNRLASDRLLDFSPKQGFFRRALSVKEISDLSDLRAEIERGAVRLAIQRASDRGIERLAAYLVEPGQADAMSGDRILELDERFHEGLAALSGNAENV
jgi:DNA-binding GntR family transcriptional regulator